MKKQLMEQGHWAGCNRDGAVRLGSVTSFNRWKGNRDQRQIKDSVGTEQIKFHHVSSSSGCLAMGTFYCGDTGSFGSLRG